PRSRCSRGMSPWCGGMPSMPGCSRGRPTAPPTVSPTPPEKQPDPRVQFRAPHLLRRRPKHHSRSDSTASGHARQTRPAGSVHSTAVPSYPALPPSASPECASRAADERDGAEEEEPRDLEPHLVGDDRDDDEADERA